MRLLRHIAAKDLRRLRWGVLASLAIAVARVVVVSLRGDMTIIGDSPRIALEAASGALWFADVALFALLVSWLVHEDPVVGSDRFWMTRPIGWRTLLAAKLAGAALVLLLAPVVVQFLSVAIVLGSATDASTTFALALVLQAIWVAIFLALAAMAPALGRFLAFVVGAAMLIVVGFTVLEAALLSRVDGGSYQTTELSDDTGQILAAVLLVVVPVIVLVEQYRTRRPLRTVLVGVVAVVLAALVVNVWPWRFARPAEPTTVVERSVSASVDPAVPPAAGDVVRAEGGPSGLKRIALPIAVSGFPPEYAQSAIAVQGRLEVAGRTIESAQNDMLSVKRPDQGASSDYWDRFSSALAPLRLVLPPHTNEYVAWPVVLRVSDDDYRRFGTTPGRLFLSLHSLVHRTHVAAVLPLRQGASVRTQGARFDVRRVVRSGDSCTALVRQTITRGDSFSRGYQFVFRNTSRGEAVISNMGGSSINLNVGGLSLGLFAFASQSSGVVPFSDVIVRTPNQPNGTTPFDEGWIDGADLVVLEDRYAGSITRTLTVEGFRMRP